ncbi:MAG: hypothetical protein HC908_11885 [Calothrix sp. SM1_7_51]|nr:hypothetical protein [Calothrix sp. SM1_7_51]
MVLGASVYIISTGSKESKAPSSTLLPNPALPHPLFLYLLISLSFGIFGGLMTWVIIWLRNKFSPQDENKLVKK